MLVSKREKEALKDKRITYYDAIDKSYFRQQICGWYHIDSKLVCEKRAGPIFPTLVGLKETSRWFQNFEILYRLHCLTLYLD